mgnify:CR=1 FL=1
MNAEAGAGAVTAAGVTAWLRAFAADIAGRRTELTELDAAIGDADHGINMDRGMRAVAAKLPVGDASADEPDAADGGAAPGDAKGEGAVGPLLKDAGMTLVSTVGGAMFAVECKIVDPETGEELPDNTDGEFCARGYNIMKGYYKMPEATAAVIDSEGWLHSGDLARRLPDGNFKITGRIKDMIIRGGENIYPKEIEEFLYTHPDVKDVQVIGVPDKQYGEEIMAEVILKEGANATAEELKDYCLSHMAKHKCPRYIDFVTEFPMNAAGKIQKYKMREAATERLGLTAAAKIETA